MSDFEHIKALRYEPTEEQIDKLYGEMQEWRKTTDKYSWIKDRNDWGEYLESVKLPLFFNKELRYSDHYFTIGYGYSYNEHKSKLYVDYILYSDYGEESKGWRKARYLTCNEKDIWRSTFEKVFSQIDIDRVHLVDYCWYNACEPEDCYDPIDDDFYKEVLK